MYSVPEIELERAAAALQEALAQVAQLLEHVRSQYEIHELENEFEPMEEAAAGALQNIQSMQKAVMGFVAELKEKTEKEEDEKDQWPSK